MKATVAVYIGCALASMTLAPLARAQDAASDQEANLKQIREQIRALNWIKGPQRVQLFGNAALDLPEGYVFLNPADAAKFDAITHNIGGGTEYFLAPADMHWESHLTFKDDGYIKDDDKIDAAAILENIKQNTEAANKIRRDRGWDEMAVIGWQTPPHYDTETHRLEWAVSGKDLKSNTTVVNFNTRILGRGGVTSAVLIAQPADLTAATNDFKSTLAAFEYNPGQRYAEYKAGDKVAKYGLAALITGGAAAIAVKTGLWKVIVGALVAGWKFIAAAVVALFSGLARRFKRKDT
jgi:uncharacterized membrane-anchored protein